MSAHVYHFTTTEYLPLILESRKLIPNRDKFGVEDGKIFPSTTLLWASIHARGDWSIPSIVNHAWGGNEGEFELGFVHLVRFTLRAADFEPWSKVIVRCSKWSPKQIKHVKSFPAARTWRCRTTPLEMERWLRVEIRPYRGPWQPYDYRNPDPVMVAAVRSYLAGQARQPDYECPQCGGTIKAIDVSGDDDIECSCCGWEGERQDCKLCRELFDSDALTS
jgi:hypothetical protein